MPVFETRFYSQTLIQDVTVTVVLPLPTYYDKEKGHFNAGQKYPTLWMMPTGTADHSKNVRSSNIEEYANQKHLAVVSAEVGNSLGFNLALGAGDYFDFLTVELPAVLRSIYPLSTKREDNFIGGASNGGFISYMIALRKPQNYAAAFCIGSGLDIERTNEIINSKEWYERKTPAIYGAHHEYYDKHIHHIRTLVEDLIAEQKIQPRFYANYGKEDIYRSFGIEAVQFMIEKQLDVTFVEENGTHDWGYWDLALKKALEWLPLTKETND